MKEPAPKAASAAAAEDVAGYPTQWVLASKYEEMTGVTREAVKQRKKSGVWKEGLQVAVISRRLYVNLKAADQWINDQLSKRRPA